MIGVYGASGFIGKHLTRSLVRQGHTVTAVARSFDPRDPTEATYAFAADLRDPDAIAKSLVGVDTVVQLMASSTPAQGNTRTSEDIQANVIPHVEFLNLCVETGVRRFIFASSGGTVYGPVGESELVSEDAPTEPICSHGVTKLTVEQFIRLHGHLHGLEYVILRVANPFGPGQVFRKGQGLIPALVNRQQQGLPVQIFGDGSAARDYLFIDDLIDAIIAAIDLGGRPNLVLNIGTGVRRSILDVVRTIEEVGGLQFDLQFVASRSSDVQSIALDARRAHDVLRWEPKVDFRDGMKQTIDALLNHP